MNRLWLTDQQTKILTRALRAHIATLYDRAEDMHNERSFELEEKYVDEANALDEILDIIDKED